MKVGVVALQGAARLHVEAIEALAGHAQEVRTPDDLAGVDALVLPGGESTVITKLVDSAGLREPLTDLIRAGAPTLLTCAGVIVAASTVVDGRADQRPLGLLGASVRRNAYGRQLESFEAPLAIEGLDGGPFPGVFIRAPVIEAVAPEVEVRAVLDGDPVLVRHGSIWAATFHPELSDDLRLHRAFLTGA